MGRKARLSFCTALLSICWPFAAPAQDAAETAVILSGTGQPAGSASRSLGSVVSGSINAAAAQIGATRSAAPATNRRGPAIPRTRAAIPSNVNALEGTDATTYRLGSGASIQVSGTLIQGAETSCSKNCPVDPVRPKTTR
jgi:hypothetical protein